MSYLIDGEEYEYMIDGVPYHYKIEINGQEHGFNHRDYEKQVISVAVDAGLGEVIRRQQPDQAFTTVYFKPNNGVLINRIDNHKETHDLIDDTYDNDVVHETCTEGDVRYMLTGEVEYFTGDGTRPEDRSFDSELLGAFLIGYEYNRYVYANYLPGTTDYDGELASVYLETFDQPEDISDCDHATSTLHYWNFTGSANDLTLTVHGQNPEAEEALEYSCTYFNVKDWEYVHDQDGVHVQESGKYLTIFRRSTQEPQAITHLVAFDEEYQNESTDMPSGFLYYPMTSTTYREEIYGGKTYGLLFVNGYDYEMKSTTEEQLPEYIPQINGLYKTTNIMIAELLSKKKSNTRIRSLLLYVDNFFAIFRGVKGVKQFYESKNFIAHHYKGMSIDKNGNICDVKLRSVKMEWRPEGGDTGKYLQLASETGRKLQTYREQIQEQYPGQQSYPYDDRVDDRSETIPSAHRWLQLMKTWDDEHLSRYTHIVKLVQAGDAVEVSDKIKVWCDYARYTGYWTCEDRKEYPYNPRVLKRTDKIPTDWLGTKVFHPIFKPWAECDLLVFQEGNGEPFSLITSNIFKQKLQSFYGDDKTSDSEQENDDVPSYFRQSWYFNAAEPTNPDIDKYFSTLSPFRTEMFLCHGTRLEYDKDKYSSILGELLNDYGQKILGQGGICYCDLLNFTDEDFAVMHDMCAWYNDRSTDMSLILYDECCFGGGIQKGIQRNVLKNSLCKNATNILNWKNILYFFSGIATHTAIGNGNNGGSETQILKNSIYQNNNTYKKWADTFNCLVNNFIEKAYTLIRKFYVNNFNLMLDCLADQNDRQMWVDTYEQILEDINNNGETYFSTENWDEKNENGDDAIRFLASDNYFDPETKKYAIHKGFIGYIKRLLLENTLSKQPNTHWKFFMSEREAQDKEKQEFYSQFEPIGEKPDGRPVYSPEDNEIIENHTWSWDEESDDNEEEIYSYLLEHPEYKKLIDHPEYVYDDTDAELGEDPQELIRGMTPFWKVYLLDLLEKMLKDSWKALMENLNYGKLSKWVPVQHPIMGYCGKFATSDAPIMQNPDFSENVWLTSDDDLEILRMPQGSST